MEIKIKILFAFLLSVISLPVDALSQEIPFSGEKLLFSLSYKCGFSTDIASVEMSAERDSSNADIFLSRTSIKTHKFYDKIYKVRDMYESRFTSALDPISFYRDVKEANYWAKNRYDWSGDFNSVKVHVEKSTRPVYDTVYSENEVMKDVINLIYTVRFVDIDRIMAGETVHYLMVMDKPICDVTVRMVERGEKKVPDLGTFRTIKLGISSRQRVSNQQESQGVKIDASKENIFFWFTDDEDHTPVFFSSPLSVGSINGKLVSFSRYE